MRHVDQQPSAHPEFGDEHGKIQQQAEVTIISGPDDVEERVDDHAWTGNKDDVSHPTGEDTPQHDGQTQHEHVNSREDWHGKEDGFVRFDLM